MKFTILFCLVWSTGFSVFALWAEGGWFKTQESTLAFTSTSQKAKQIQQELDSADENGKTKIFDDYIAHIQARDKAVSASIASSFAMTSTVVYSVVTFNVLAAFCVIYLLLKGKQPKPAPEPN